MAITIEEVRSALEPEEPDYTKAAKNLGPEALTHLERLIAGDHPMLASKAAYLAGLIGTERSVEILERAARSSDVRIRIAAAAAARNLPPESASDVLLTLIDDSDIGVQKVALKSVPSNPSVELKSRIEGLSAGRSESPIRRLSREAMGNSPTQDTAAKRRKTKKK